MKRVLLCAGEASGDQLAADLARELSSRRGDLQVVGLCGPRMRRAGVGAIRIAEDATAVGAVEILGGLPRIARVYQDLVDELDRHRPDLVVTVDSPGLLLRVARAARSRGIPTIHWVCPQVWAWRRSRIERLSDAVDTLLCLFPFEVDLFAATELNAVFVGHPAVDRVPAEVWDPSGPLALLPGSRPGEIRRLWPIFREVGRRIGGEIVIPVAPTVDREAISGLEARLVNEVEEIAGARAALVASGTATLEVALMGIPQVVAYQVHPITWAIGRRIVTGVDHLALPNVILSRGVVPEILQDLDITTIIANLERVGEAQVQELAELREALGGGGAIARVADQVEEALGSESLRPQAGRSSSR